MVIDKSELNPALTSLNVNQRLQYARYMMTSLGASGEAPTPGYVDRLHSLKAAINSTMPWHMSSGVSSDTLSSVPLPSMMIRMLPLSNAFNV